MLKLMKRALEKYFEKFPVADIFLTEQAVENISIIRHFEVEDKEIQIRI